MITRIAIDSGALRPSADKTALDRLLQSRRLAETVRDYGLLAVLGKADEDELKAVFRQLQDEVGYDFWRPLLTALTNSGPGVIRPTPRMQSTTRELCESGNFEQLRTAADLVVVDGTAAPIPGLADAQVESLYTTDGHADVGDSLELALPAAADLSRAVATVKDLRRGRPIEVGTVDTELWTRYFSLLAGASTQVSIFDRYIFSGLITSKNRRRTDVKYLLWLLNSLDRDLPTTATVNLFAYTGEMMARTNRDKTAQPYSISDIEAALGRLERWNRARQLHLYLWDGLHHDRHIRFGPGYAISPKQGFDQLRFRQGQLQKKFAYSFTSLSTTGASEAERGPGTAEPADEDQAPSLTELIENEQEAMKEGGHWVLRSKKAGFEPVELPR